ncbi:hypothetical protein C8F04DRAFT_1176906 [Mycena alexandri]|uniref:Uncharacterized protein n=1 Tax=Mycena alexandri TaxID=1745969 RepID=A0AAD6TA36_9AGAR|nr:hypothetical protein C8F04DRAFT_1176906 [Mycena alexandri]
MRVSFQPTEGNLKHPVIDGKLMMMNVPKAFIDTLDSSPDKFRIIVPFLGGADFFELHGKANLVAAIINIVTDTGLAEEDDLEAIPLSPDKPPSWRDPYAPPWILALQADDETLGRLAAISPTSLTAIWPSTLSGTTPASARGQSLSTPYPPRLGTTQMGCTYAGSIQTRLLDWVWTVYTIWNEHSGHWCVYAEPCTPDYEGWESVRASMRAKPLYHAASLCSFTPLAKELSWGTEQHLLEKINHQRCLVEKENKVHVATCTTPSHAINFGQKKKIASARCNVHYTISVW